ncbi:hypothetical protein GA0115246_113456 [Streptomyces sp. SolWspMP-sol7th]|nr:hypothetical protein GA0115246_113456 [Streptomyces sp. SolWspMP-sol7th]
MEECVHRGQGQYLWENPAVRVEEAGEKDEVERERLRVQDVGEQRLDAQPPPGPPLARVPRAA